MKGRLNGGAGRRIHPLCAGDFHTASMPIASTTRRLWTRAGAVRLAQMRSPAEGERAAQLRGAADRVPRRAEGAEVAAPLVPGGRPARTRTTLAHSQWERSRSDPAVRPARVAARPLQGAVRTPPGSGSSPRGGADGARGRALVDRDDLRRGGRRIRGRRLASAAREHVLVPV